MNKRRVGKIVGIALTVSLMTGCVSMGNLVANLMTGKTDNLDDVKVQATYTSHEYPKATGTTLVSATESATGKPWVDGDNMLAFTFFKRDGLGMLELEGSVEVNGSPTPYIGMGSYADSSNSNSERTFKLSSAKGQTLNGSVKPIAGVEIVSVNGATGKVNLDLTKPLVLKLKNPANTSGSYLRVSFLVDAVGTREFYPIGVFKSADTINIPAQVLRNGTTPNVAHYNYNEGDGFLLVERFAEKIEVIQGVPVKIVRKARDTREINVTRVPELIVATGVEGKVANDMIYALSSPNASAAKPLTLAKKFALASLSVKGVLKATTVDQSTSSSAMMNTTTTTTTTTTYQFPQLPDSYWESYMASVYNDVRNILAKKYGISFVPVSSVVNAKAYTLLHDVEEENTEVAISKTYAGTKTLVASGFMDILDQGSKSSGFVANEPKMELMKELGVDGLVSISIELGMPKQSPITLSPKVAITIDGVGIDYDAPAIVYAQGVIQAKVGRGFNDTMLENPKALNYITRADDVATALEKGLGELTRKQKENGYNAAWALR